MAIVDPLKMELLVWSALGIETFPLLPVKKLPQLSGHPRLLGGRLGRTEQEGGLLLAALGFSLSH